MRTTLRTLLWPAAWLLALLLTFAVAGRAQEKPALNISSQTSLPVGSAKVVVLLPLEENRPPSMLPVHAGVSIMVMGEFADWATSWRQPERNPLLAERSGPYTGLLYKTGTYRKLGLTAGLVTASYAVAWRYPRHRKLIGWLGVAVGYTALCVALSNILRNPYYR